jgi:hypothetical protein
MFPRTSDGQRGGHQHLRWNRQECGEQTDGHRPRDRVAIEVPEVRVMQQLAEKA